MSTPDSVALAVVKNALEAIGDEMALMVIRTSHSSIVRDLMDFSTALCDADGEMLAQGLTLPLHLGSIPDAMSSVLSTFRGAVEPGDVIVMNDPYAGGMHLPDLFMFRPAFLRGSLLGFAAVVVHHLDIGGRVAGGGAADSTEIFQEGLRIPPLKLYARGRPDRDLIALIRKNVRMPDQVLADLDAQAAACRWGERKLASLAEGLGSTRFRRHCRLLLDHTERLTRDQIRRFPRGEFRFTDYLDDDGLDGDPVRIAVCVRTGDGEVACDFEGTSPQVRGALNATLSFTKSAVYLSLRALMDPDIPNNAGFFRPIRVTAPPGTVVNPSFPAACGARGVTGYRVSDAVLGALAEALPDRVCAAGEGGTSSYSLAGTAPDGSYFLFRESMLGAWGACADRDGNDGAASLAVNLSNTPVEVVEREQPIRIEQYGFVPDSCGAGRFRGGLALVRDLRLLGREAMFQIRSDRRRHRPYGLAGGKPGAPSMTILNPGPDQRVLPAKTVVTLREGDLVRHATAGGGGHGPASARRPADIQRDSADGKITPEYAAREFGWPDGRAAGDQVVSATPAGQRG